MDEKKWTPSVVTSPLGGFCKWICFPSLCLFAALHCEALMISCGRLPLYLFACRWRACWINPGNWAKPGSSMGSSLLWWLERAWACVVWSWESDEGVVLKFGNVIDIGRFNQIVVCRWQQLDRFWLFNPFAKCDRVFDQAERSREACFDFNRPLRRICLSMRRKQTPKRMQPR